MNEVLMNRLARIALVVVLSLAAFLLTGSVHPDVRLAKATPHPAESAARAFAADLPAAQQSEWNAAAAERPVYFFRLSTFAD